MKKILMTAMMTSISEVMETMFFLPVEYGEETSISQTGLKPGERLACRLAFTGDVSGSLLIAAPESLVREMASNFMGESGDRLSFDHLSGTLTEMANMVCGNALSKVESSKPFTLGIPELTDEAGLSGDHLFRIVETTASKMAVAITMDKS